ncbi:MAG: hypothetical protein K1X36_06300 [Pyrinomonadaceae bacterium]|nr:hypothetical protein [Pyrinomonadaceae bacterium]
MALVIINTDGPLRRAVLAAAVMACLCMIWFFGKWSFANAVSARADLPEIAELMIGLAPSDPQTHFAAAVLRERTFDPNDAAVSLAEYEASAALTPNNYLSWLALGRARERAGDAVGAEAALKRAMILAPNYADVKWAYGNWLIRSGRTDDGFVMIREAVAGKPDLLLPAASMAMQLMDGDIDRVRATLGDSTEVNAALAGYFLSKKSLDEAFDAWERMGAAVRDEKYRPLGENMTAQLAAGSRFRLAGKTMSAIAGDGESFAGIGRLSNGDFEAPVKLRDAKLFEWQIGAGPDPQAGISEGQPHGGRYSLMLIFNTMQAADMRSITQTAAVEPGVSYTVEGYFRSELKGGVALEVADASDGKPLVRSAAFGPQSEWARFRIEFQVPLTTDGIVVRFVRDGCVSSVCPISGKLWIDDISMSAR